MLKAGGEMSVARDRRRLNWKEKSFTAPIQVVNSTEPPDADPQARWCGRGAASRPPYPDYLSAVRQVLLDQVSRLTMIAGPPILFVRALWLHNRIQDRLADRFGRLQVVFFDN